MNTERYSFEQIFCGLREAWGSSCKPFAPETSIYCHLKAEWAWHEFDAGMEALCLEQFFGFEASEAEWKAFLRFDVPADGNWERDGFPCVTFGDLARFIAERTPATTKFEPVTVFGRSCGPAGAFYGLQQIAEPLQKSPQRFAPSTPILDVLRSEQLDHFWRQVRWRTEDLLPKLSGFWSGVTVVTLLATFVAVASSLFVGKVTGSFWWPIAIISATYLIHQAARCCRYFANPLPTECVTFRDLSHWIARRRQAAA